jgi:hypothetical protein
MKIPASALAEQAEALLHGKFARLREPTKYIASFRSGSGRHLALTRQVKNDIYIWAEGFNESLNGVSIKNREFPGLPYLPEQPRSSNLTAASSRLGLGNLSFYIKCDTLGALDRFASWYEST